MPKIQKVLDDHVQIGKIFKPPFLRIEPMQEVSWIKHGVPEFLWLGLLIREHGFDEGLELSLALAKAASAASGADIWFAPTSAFSKLTHDQSEKIVEYLKPSKAFYDIIYTLNPLVSLYPKCPFGFLVNKDSAHVNKTKEIAKIKDIVLNLFDKGERNAMLVIANALQIAFDTKILFVATNVTFLEGFEEITGYPTTEKSRMVGSSIRATYNLLVGMYEYGPDWSNYFWNRGLEIDRCDIGDN